MSIPPASSAGGKGENKALYRKFARRGTITNKLIYRGHEFKEIWEKDVVLMCKENIIIDQVKEIFDDLNEKEVEIIKNLGFYTDFDLEEKMSELSDYEALHEVGSSKERR